MQSPEEFFGFTWGERFAYHHQIVAYFRHIAQQSDRVKLIEYGQTHEGRSQIAAIISAPENLQSLEDIRQNNLKSIGMLAGNPDGKRLLTVWLNYSIHGNESAGVIASVPTLYALVNDQRPEIADWLQEMIVVIDPSVNPDGYARYVNWYQQKVGIPPSTSPNTWEHDEPWPGGRYNHYLFDLNRDWAWQSQLETRNRLKLYHDWMPQVHADLHEMGYNSPYFFAPAAKPFHEEITDWQREFQTYLGKNHSKYFDEKGWLYYTKEVYDLFYPGYGDTWPIFNGAMGFTYEQGGSGRAGIQITTETKDTLSLKDRYQHHFTTSLSTIEISYQYRERLLNEFDRYFANGQKTTSDTYQSYVIKAGKTPDRQKALLDLLDLQKIQYGSPRKAGVNLSGLAYQDQQNKSFSLEEEDIVISASQPKAKLLKVLFEPQSELEDSLTYDLTAWALPYAYNLESYALTQRLDPNLEAEPKEWEDYEVPSEMPYAYLIPWHDVKQARFLGKLLQNEIKVRFAEKDFTLHEETFPRGTLVVLKADQNTKRQNWNQTLVQLANQQEQEIFPIQSGLVAEGKDLGSDYVRPVLARKIALVGGEGVGTSDFGELWHYFEQVLEYPVSVINRDQLGRISAQDFQVLVLPSGNYNEYSRAIEEFASAGGKVIALERAIRTLTDFSNNRLGKQLKKMEQEEEKQQNPKEDSVKSEKLLKKYGERERRNLSESVAGAIFKVTLDASHPLAFGQDSIYYVMKQNSKIYPYLPEGGWNVGTFPPDAHVSGFVGYELKRKLKHSLAFGVESQGRGQLIYFVDSPVFRGFWHSGKLLMANALFLVD